jgi:murein L,D-transpeptidase YafK
VTAASKNIGNAGARHRTVVAAEGQRMNKAVLLVVGLLLATPASALGPSGRVTEIHIAKAAHTLELRAGETVVKTYKVALGSGGEGPKRFEGDAVTPVGTYKVSGRIKGLFHEFLVVSYPNEEDRRRFAERKRRGEVPAGRTVGSGIGIHGVGDPRLAGVHKRADWTLGCIALDDDEIDEVSRIVKDGTKIVITD